MCESKFNNQLTCDVDAKLARVYSPEDDWPKNTIQNGVQQNSNQQGQYSKQHGESNGNSMNTSSLCPKNHMQALSVLIIVPWLTVGGADQYVSISLFQSHYFYVC
jgi:hypothetical protein